MSRTEVADRSPMQVRDRERSPLSPKEGWISDGRQVLHFQPRRYDRWSQSLEVTFGEVMPGGEPPLLKHRRELMRDEAVKLWAQKRQQGWRACGPQWSPPKPPRA
ncbi:DUF1651 domain-containing protein [Cyanobium sp. Maggiore-St4-Cus]|uniref:DUF1651 domain-containing protein n=1 Tax=Cyanobium sp. Maggiore-St4-Cus TaxID=2823717 RepID=UPI0020CDA9C2|nr:DUF1651 domain-containing protein [Cyanobium sp. Maggiore-St4-Cus]